MIHNLSILNRVLIRKWNRRFVMEVNSPWRLFISLLFISLSMGLRMGVGFRNLLGIAMKGNYTAEAKLRLQVRRWVQSQILGRCLV